MVEAVFSAAMLVSGVEQTLEEVEAICTRLARRQQLVREGGVTVWPDGTLATLYGFLHALYPEVVYARIPARRRARLHRQIGQRTEAAYGEQWGDVAAVLAHHYTKAGLGEQALPGWQQAGQRAIQRAAYTEAIAHFTRGLEVCQALPDQAAHAGYEIELSISLGASLMATKGYAAPETRQAYARAQTLCQQVGEPVQLVGALRGLATCYRLGGALEAAREIGEQLLHMAQRQPGLTLLAEAHQGLGQTLWFQGELCRARAHLEQKFTQAASPPNHAQPLLYGRDPDVPRLCYAACTLALLGYPVQARQQLDEAYALGQMSRHPFGLAFISGVAAILHHFLREPQAAQAWAVTCLTISTEYGFVFWMAATTIIQGWAHAVQGLADAGIAQLQEGLAVWQGTRAETLRPYYLALLTEAYLHGGQTKAARYTLDEALTLVERTGERWWEAELYRLKGERLLSVSAAHHADAAACFNHALEVARGQQAKWLELRAAMSLSRLWQQQGKPHKDRDRLEAVYNGFTEGFDTADLREAKVLLDALRG